MSEVSPSATVVLVRDGSNGLETLLLQRSAELNFAPGHWVFPGGKIDRADFGDDSDDLEAAARRAAVREVREETAITIGESSLLYFAHWVTPETFPRRFATWFFIREFPADGQSIQVDGGEIVDSRWCRPHQALEDYENKRLAMMPPTYVTLMQLLPCETVADAIQSFQELAVQNFLPRVVEGAKPVVMLYEGDAGFETVNAELSGPRHRLILADSGYQYLREPEVNEFTS